MSQAPDSWQQKYDYVITILPVLLSIVIKKNELNETKDLEFNGNLFMHRADFIFRGFI